MQIHSVSQTTPQKKLGFGKIPVKQLEKIIVENGLNIGVKPCEIFPGNFSIDILSKDGIRMATGGMPDGFHANFLTASIKTKSVVKAIQEGLKEIAKIIKPEGQDLSLPVGNDHVIQAINYYGNSCTRIGKQIRVEV